MDLAGDLAKDGDIAGRGDGEAEGHECTNMIVHSGWQGLFRRGDAEGRGEPGEVGFGVGVLGVDF
jgi:hypothetical protein